MSLLEKVFELKRYQTTIKQEILAVMVGIFF
jgi:hypothetical protein